MNIELPIGDIDGASPLYTLIPPDTLQQAKDGWHWHKHLQTELCPVLIIKPLPDLRCLQYARPHHGSSAYSWGLALANTIRNRFFLLLIKPLPDLHHLCGHCQPDFGE